MNVALNPGLGGEEFDAGVFGSLGSGIGVNASTDIFGGVILGDIKNISGSTGNINLVIGPISVTVLLNGKTLDDRTP